VLDGNVGVIDVKFCGITRAEDSREAVRLGASFVGVVMTESLRRVEPERAREVFASLEGAPVKRVCVFGREPIDQVIRVAGITGCDVVQMHGGVNDPKDVSRLRRELEVEIWEVIRMAPDGPGATPLSAAPEADGVLIDTLARDALGGSGITFDWRAAAGAIRDLRLGRRLIVAGGLRPENVRQAIDQLAPDVVDVSSGVESAPGIKDHARMAAFMAAVRQTTTAAVQ